MAFTDIYYANFPEFILILTSSSSSEKRLPAKCKFPGVCFGFDVELELRKASADKMQNVHGTVCFDLDVELVVP